MKALYCCYKEAMYVVRSDEFDIIKTCMCASGKNWYDKEKMQEKFHRLQPSICHKVWIIASGRFIINGLKLTTFVRIRTYFYLIIIVVWWPYEHLYESTPPPPPRCLWSNLRAYINLVSHTTSRMTIMYWIGAEKRRQLSLDFQCILLFYQLV